MNKAKTVPGKNKIHEVLMYAISTCPWCKKAKGFFKKNEVEFKYIDVDLCSVEDAEKVRKDILNRGGVLIYPAIIIDDKILLNNPTEGKLKSILNI